MRTHSFDQLRARVRAQPGADEEIEAHKRAMRDVLKLTELRAQSTQGEPTNAAAGDHAHDRLTLSDGGEDAYLATLRASIEAMGGHLQISAIFPDATVTLVTSSDPEIESTDTGDRIEAAS